MTTSGPQKRRFLVACATATGSTLEVAEAIADELRAVGHEADVRRAREAPSPDGYDAVVVGGPMIMGWQREAVRYVKRYERELAVLPTAYFITAMALTDTGTEQVDGVPLFKDPWLAKATGVGRGLTRKERYARPEHYLGDVLAKAPVVRPRTVAFLGGRLDLATLSLWRKLFVMLVVGATPGDGRNWEVIRGWGRSMAALLAVDGRSSDGRPLPAAGRTDG